MGCNCVTGKSEVEIDDQRIQQIGKLFYNNLFFIMLIFIFI